MMQELIELQTALFNVGVDSKALYDLKLEIIQFATNIAMLRLWLSLAIDYEGEKPEPLPNLDFKIVRGDSLLGPDPGLVDQSSYMIRVSELPMLKAQYMRATVDKAQLKQKVAAAAEKLRDDMGMTPCLTTQSIGALSLQRCSANVAGSMWSSPIHLTSNCKRTAASWATFTRTLDSPPSSEQAISTSSSSSVAAVFSGPATDYWPTSPPTVGCVRNTASPHVATSPRNTLPCACWNWGKGIFESAIVDSSVLVVREGIGPSALRSVDMDRLPGGRLPPADDLWGETRPGR